MGFGQLLTLLDTFGGFVQLTGRVRRYVSDLPAVPPAGGAGSLGPLETRLAGVVVAALKEAFDRDSARLELERAHIEAERRRAEEALRAELRRQAADRVLGQLKLIVMIAVGIWALSAAIGVWLPGMRLGLPRVLLGAGWLCALGTIGAAFAGWRHVSTISADPSGVALEEPGPAAAAFAPWLLMAALALTGASLLAAL
jgi:hypothetical protein